MRFLDTSSGSELLKLLRIDPEELWYAQGAERPIARKELFATMNKESGYRKLSRNTIMEAKPIRLTEYTALKPKE